MFLVLIENTILSLFNKFVKAFNLWMLINFMFIIIIFSRHLKYEEFLKDGLKSNLTEDRRSSCLDVMVRSLNEKIESLSSENSRLLIVQQELQSKLKDVSEEKRALLASEQSLKSDVNKK